MKSTGPDWQVAGSIRDGAGRDGWGFDGWLAQMASFFRTLGEENRPGGLAGAWVGVDLA